MNETKAIINLQNLNYNFLAIRRRTKTKVMAVVKADAYGHGMIKCVKALEMLDKKKPEYYGVALLQEAIELRKAKITKQPIVCFAPFKKDDFEYYLRYRIQPTITSEKQIIALSKIKLRKIFKVHVNINSGMGRLGIGYKNAVEQMNKLSKIDYLHIDGVYTHFATSDEKNKTFANLQLKRFTDVIAELKKLKINYGIVHAANSGAILDMPNAYYDMVRPGISLYGYYPSLKTSESIKLKPVMSLVSKVSTIMEIKKNDTIGYGRKYKAKRNMNAGTLPIGYADGLLRGLSNKIKIIINNSLFNQVGRISMDRISIDLGNSKIKEGAKVILLGRSKDHQITAWDWSKILNTIPYEITCSISKRVPREYIFSDRKRGGM
ncbi:MAG: alanine racemase [Ignavibacteriae bacterium]|nr:alanine racemase [Ignavibacteriota bacterium]